MAHTEKHVFQAPKAVVPTKAEITVAQFPPTISAPTVTYIVAFGLALFLELRKLVLPLLKLQRAW